VYTIAPITGDKYVQQLISTHVQALSQPDERGERISFFWLPTPDRAVDASVEGGSGDAQQTAQNDVLQLIGFAPTTPLISAGIADPSAMPASDGVYLEVILVAAGSTSVLYYNVSTVNGYNCTINRTFATGENDDGFYSTTEFSATASYDSISYNLRVRGDKLLIKGTTLPDITAICSAAAEQATGYAHRRVFMMFADSVDISIDGVITNVPGYYFAPGVAGMVASQSPEQPFTNVMMTGYGTVYGTDDTYSENQLDVIADGGRYILKNMSGGAATRHQRSTAIATIESRELSITKAIDYLAKGLREINRVFIGKYVITPGFLDQLTMANEGYLRAIVQQGIVRAATLKSLLQSETDPDTVLIEIEVAVAYPCNKIRITIVS
jgi:hypothetical protein